MNLSFKICTVPGDLVREVIGSLAIIQYKIKFAKPPLKLVYVWVMTSYTNPRMWFFLYVLIIVKSCQQN